MSVNLAVFNVTNESEQNWLIYTSLGGTAVNLATFNVTNSSEQRWLIYQQIASPAGSSGVVMWVPTPASPTDFSGLPGGVLPTGNQIFFAKLDQNSLWSISSSDTQWKIVDTHN